MPDIQFLAGLTARPIQSGNLGGFSQVQFCLGQGNPALEVVFTEAHSRPTAEMMRGAWKTRSAGRAVPVLFVVLYGRRVATAGVGGNPEHVLLDLDRNQLEQVCRTALAAPDQHVARRLLNQALTDLEAGSTGWRNMGLFATHFLRSSVPKHERWPEACRKGHEIHGKRRRELLAGLGLTVDEANGQALILRAADARVALAVLLEAQEQPELALARFNQLSPVSYALAKAEAYNLPFVLVLGENNIRLYPVGTGVGAGQRSRSETYLELDLNLITPEQAGYLWLIFSAEALRKGGTVQSILDGSSRYAAGLGERLRDRVYTDVVPPLAEGLMAARSLRHPSAKDLAETYEMALIILFRLLFIAYAEDQDLLPYSSNSLYRDRSLKKKAQEFTTLLRADKPRGGGQSDHWDEAKRLFRAIDKGNTEWGIPAYNGGLFSSDDSNSLGKKIVALTLPDRVFAPVLEALIVDRTEEGWGPVDFRSLGVREFGTIYEGLLENELSLAETDLATDKEGNYRPAKGKDTVVVQKGRAFLHNTSGQRKSTGSYFTKHFAVEHLLDHGLEPALKAHVERLDGLDEIKAAAAFFDFRVADITMGSAHFLVAAVDRIERALLGYLARRPLAAVNEELDRLRKVARAALADETGQIQIEDGQLLRRQIARRCVYGVDVNPTAVSLARLAIWIHTFVPGLPLSFLDRTLVIGNSLVGIATIAEADEWFRDVAGPLFHLNAEALIGSARAGLSEMGRLSDATAAEIQSARQAYLDAYGAVADASALFDVLTAARIDDEIRSSLFQDASHWGSQIRSLAGSTLHRRARKVLEALPPFHFPIAFPEVFLRERPGFDVILGNPPWEEATVEEDRFWTRHQPGFHSLKQKDQEAAKKTLRRTRPDLVVNYEKEKAEAELLRLLLVKGPFPGMGTGDPDTYKAAAWRFFALAREGAGRVSVVMPRSAFAAKGSEEFRRSLFASCQFEDLTMLLNRGEWVFEGMEPRYTIVLVSWLKSAPSADETMPLRGPYSTPERFVAGTSKPAPRYSVREVLSWTDSASLPMLPTDESLGVFVQLRKSPRFDTDDGVTWRVRPHTELHATNDKPLMKFADEQPDGYWPIFKGESFDLWDCDTGSYYAWGKPEKICKDLQKTRERVSKRSAFFGFDSGWLRDPDTLPCKHCRIAFRDVTRATDSRTTRAALLPPEVFITNVAPYLLWLRGDEKDQAFLLGVMASLPFDWYSRRFVEIHLNYHVLNPFPVPRPENANGLWKRTVELAGRLASPDRRFRTWARAVGVECGKLQAEEKEDRIHELDAVVAHLYGLSETQLCHIFETFHEGWDYRERLEATLEHYRRWQTKR